jgi:hypothetical protein
MNEEEMECESARMKVSSCIASSTLPATPSHSYPSRHSALPSVLACSFESTLFGRRRMIVDQEG